MVVESTKEGGGGRMIYGRMHTMIVMLQLIFYLFSDCNDIIIYA